MQLNFYTSKHAVIEQLLSAIEGTVSSGISEKNAGVVFTVLTKFASAVRSHLVSEDTYLYPDLLKSAVPATRKTAETYRDQMTAITQRFEDFIRDFNSTNTILTQKDAFVQEFKDLASALRTRMAKEEKELYKLI